MLPQYQVGQAKEYADAKGWQYKEYGEHIVLRECPFCGKRDKLYWNNTNGAFDCKSAACGTKGNYFTLRKSLGDPVNLAPSAPIPVQVKKRYHLSDFAKFEAALAESEPAMAYLAGRGITEESVKSFHLGLKNENGVDWLMIPYLTKQNEIADVKYRTLPPAEKRFKRLGGGESILYGEHLLPKECDELYLCEGELDAITLTQHGFTPALSTTTGAASFSPRWYDLIVSSGAKRIILLYDSDPSGRAGAKKLIDKFTDDSREVLDVILDDAKDANEYFLTHTAAELREAISKARPAEMEYCLSPAAVIDRLEYQIFMSGNGFDGIPSKFQALNDLIDGGYGNGFLISVVGGPGTGKTSFILDEFISMGEQGMATYLCCLELPEEMLYRKLFNSLYHIPLRDIKQDHIRQYRADIERRKIYVGRGPKRVDKLIETMQKAAKRYDLRCIAFDNIHYFVRDKQNEQAEIGILTKGLKDLAMELNIPIIAIGQPKKFDRAERIINEGDVKGSGSVEQDSDNMILLWRPTLRTDIKDFGKTLGQHQNLSPLTLFRVGKARYSPGGETIMYFHGEIGRFREMTPEEIAKLRQDVEPEPTDAKNR